MNKLFATAAILAAMMSGPALAEQTPRQITVTGEGHIEAVPDMATISLGVTSEAPKATEAMAETSTAVERILAKLTEKGIAARDMQTQRLTLNPVWSQDGNEPRQRARITGYTASNMILVRVRDLDGLGGILDAVIADGANDFNGLEFSVQEMKPLVAQARDAAVAEAMAKARQLAEAAGVTLGAVQSISEMGGGRPMPMQMQMAARDGGVPIAAGEVTVDATVSMVFAISD